MAKAGFAAAGDVQILPPRVTGVARGADEIENDLGGLVEAAKLRAAKRAHTPSSRAETTPGSSSSLLPTIVVPVSVLATSSSSYSTPSTTAFASTSHAWLNMGPEIFKVHGFLRLWSCCSTNGLRIWTPGSKSGLQSMAQEKCVTPSTA